MTINRLYHKVLCYLGIHNYYRRTLFRIPKTDGTMHNITQPYCKYCDNVPDWWWRQI